MQTKHYKIQFPQLDSHDLQQNEVFFYLHESSGKRKIRFHDYAEIYQLPGLYEQVFYDRLKCNSPEVVAKILKSTLEHAQENLSELRVLDLGAGNGMMGEAVQEYGVSRMVGVDIIVEAQEATERDRPNVYDAYYVADFCSLNEDKKEELSSWSLNCLITVAALGFGDIPPQAFMEAFNIIQPQGWVAFNIKESFLSNADSSGFSRMIRELIFSKYLDLHHLERYRHRLSVEGEPLFYFAIVAKKKGDVPPEFFEKFLE